MDFQVNFLSVITVVKEKFLPQMDTDLHRGLNKFIFLQ